MPDREADISTSHVARRSPEEALFAHRLGASVRRHRLAVGLSQEGLGRSVALSRASIANMERGTQTPPLYRFVLMAEALGCTVQDLIPGPARDTVDMPLTEGRRSAVDRVLKSLKSARTDAS